MENPEVVVVGAGPVGLSLALGLAGEGVRVLVLEKEPGTAEHSRAPAIWPRTQEVLGGLGVAGRLLERGMVVRRLEVVDADRDRTLLEAPMGELEGETPFPQLLVLPQSETERLLAEAVRENGRVRLLLGAEVVGVEQGGGRVRVTYRQGGEVRGGGSEPGTETQPETVEARFVAGCDGAHSAVREALDLDFDGVTYELRAALADVRPRGAGDGERGAPADGPFARVTTRGGPAVGLHIDERLWRLILPIAPGDERSLDERVETAVASLFSATGGEGEPEPDRPPPLETAWQSEFRLHRRLASRFAVGRVALAGDAAHLNSPVGGQGMNAGIQDAEVLAPALVQALERDDPAPLADYGRRRREAIEEGVNRRTDRMTRVLLFGRGRLIKPVLRLGGLALRLPPLRRLILRRMAMLDPR